MASVSARRKEMESADTMAAMSAPGSVGESAALSELHLASESATASVEEKELRSDEYWARESEADLDRGTATERAPTSAQDSEHSLATPSESESALSLDEDSAPASAAASALGSAKE